MDPQARQLLQLKAQVLQALAHPIRLSIVEVLRDGERCVCDIAEAVGAERSNVSRHLGLMLRTGLLSQRKEGLRVIYSLRTPCLVDFLACTTAVLREQLVGTRSALSRLGE